MSTKDRPAALPPLWYYLTEGSRASIELGLYLMGRPLWHRLPKGDGHPVLVIPGFLTSDNSTLLLRHALGKLGYDVHTWDQGFNLATEEEATRVCARIAEIHARSGRRVSVVGWSMGGVYARMAGHQVPDLLRRIVMLGTPFKGLYAQHRVSWVHRLVHRQKDVELSPDQLALLVSAPSVPSTSIFSKEDGIVAWQHCEEDSPLRHIENVRTRGSHFGMVHNPAVLYCLADRLSQPDGYHAPFLPLGL